MHISQNLLIVYQVAQGRPIKAELEFSKKNLSCLSGRTGRPIKAKREFSKKILVVLSNTRCI